MSLAERFCTWVEHEGVSDRTAQIYQTDVQLFLDFLAANERTLRRETNENFIAYLESKGFTRATTERKFSSLKAFSRFLQSLGRKPIQFNRDIKKCVNELEPAFRVPSITESQFSVFIEAVMANASMKLAKDLYGRARDAVAASLYFRTGALTEQVVELDAKDVDIAYTKSQAQVQVNFKTRIPRVTDIGKKRIYSAQGLEGEILRDYHEMLEQFREMKLRPNEPAHLLNTKGRRIHSRALRRRMTKVGVPFGPVNPRRLRQSYLERQSQ